MCGSTQERLSVSVVVPALNEEGAIATVVSTALRQAADSFFVAEVVVVDNGSIDKTAASAKAAGARVVREDQRGYGAACLAGIAASTATDLLCFIDGDGSDFPEDLERLVTALLSERADLVVGSRARAVCEGGVLPLHQRFGNTLVALLLGVPFGVRLTDLGPFRLIRRDVLLALGMQDRAFGWTIEMQLKVLQQGFRLIEVPVRYRKRAAGKSKIGGTLYGSFFAGVTILRVLGKGYWQHFFRSRNGKYSCS